MATTRLLVQAPPVVPAPFGIFSIAEPRLASDPHWRFGVTWQTQACSPTKLTAGECWDERQPPLDPDDYCSVMEYDPFTVYAYNNDQIVGHSLEEHAANAVARLTNGEQWSVEDHFWGTMTAELGAAVDLSAFHHGVVLGYVEQAISDTYFGQGVIHMNRLTATILWEYLDVSGGRLQTRLGTPVIAGGGYDNISTPPSGDFLIYGTGPVVMYRGDIDTRQSAIDKAVNEVSYIAQRDYVLGWDCTIVGAKGAYQSV